MIESDMFQDVGGTLVANYPKSPGFKRDGTSQEAAESMHGVAPTLRDSVLAVLRHRPSTADELANMLGKSVLAIRPRVSELLALGKIVDAGNRRLNSSGKSAVVWRLA